MGELALNFKKRTIAYQIEWHVGIFSVLILRIKWLIYDSKMTW